MGGPGSVTDSGHAVVACRSMPESPVGDPSRRRRRPLPRRVDPGGLRRLGSRPVLRSRQARARGRGLVAASPAHGRRTGVCKRSADIRTSSKRPTPRGVVSDPLERPVQVAVLEQGGVLIQYRVPGSGKALAALADDASVVIAPNPDLPAAVVATAWAVKLTCTRVDVVALRTFITDHPVVGRSHE